MIYQTLLDQESLMFTGRINVLDKKTSAMLGHIHFREGIIVSVAYQKKIDKNALVLIFFNESQFDTLKYIVEPEILKESDDETHLKFSGIVASIESGQRIMKEVKNLRPSENLRFLLNAEFLNKGDAVEKEEFELMKIIVDYGLVRDIYKKSLTDETTTTLGLISLRKKGAIKVVKYK